METSKLRTIIDEIKKKQKQEKLEREKRLQELKLRNRGKFVDDKPETEECKFFRF